MTRKSAIKFTKLIRVCIYGAPSMIGKTAGTVALLERYQVRPLLKYHCIIHQESVWKSFEFEACYDFSCKMCEQNSSERTKQKRIHRIFWTVR